MKLQSASTHPHGLPAEEFDALFTVDKPIVFAFHGYPWLIHRLLYRHTNHQNLHVHGYQEEGTITTYFDMKVLNELDRFHLVLAVLKRLPKLGNKGIALAEEMEGKLIKHHRYIREHGVDMPEVLEWKWGGAPQ
jgi:xylulose-5-phosphate/fructose-6-phosphate phosphoketolase